MKNKKLANIITNEIKKYASTNGSYSGNANVMFKGVKLIIDGEEKVCEGYALVSFSFDWYRDEGDYWQPPEYKIENLEYEIDKIEELLVENDNDTYYTDEKVAQILEENYENFKDDIYEEVRTIAYEVDTY